MGLMLFAQASEPKSQKAKPAPPPVIGALQVTSDHKYVVVATAEDKAILVLEIGVDGSLTELSKRYASICSHGYSPK